MKEVSRVDTDVPKQNAAAVFFAYDVGSFFNFTACRFVHNRQQTRAESAHLRIQDRMHVCRVSVRTFPIIVLAKQIEPASRSSMRDNLGAEAEPAAQTLKECCREHAEQQRCFRVCVFSALRRTFSRVIEHTERIARAAECRAEGAAVADAFQCVSIRNSAPGFHQVRWHNGKALHRCCRAMRKEERIGAGEVAYRKHAAQIKLCIVSLPTKSRLSTGSAKIVSLKTAFFGMTVVASGFFISEPNLTKTCRN